MSDLGLALDQVTVEQKRFWRNPASAIFTFVFPIAFLVIFGSLSASSSIRSLGGIDYNQFFTPNIVAFGVMDACFVNIGISLTVRRDMGFLKRVRGTPLPPSMFIGGVIANAFLVSAVLAVIVVTFGMVAYGVELPLAHVPELALVLLIGAACFAALGLAVTTFIPNADSAPAIVNAVYFPLVFLSGTFFPLRSDSVLARIAAVFPVRHFLLATFATFDPFRRGTTVAWSDVAVMVAWGAAGALVAVRRFRWEPRVR